MSLANANAFYELAIRHMKCLPTIHMIRVGEEIPFDVFPYRAVHFSYHDPADIDTAQAELRSVIEETIKLGLVIENPITHARGVIDFQEHATEAQKLILDELHTLRQRVSTVEAIASTISKNVAPVLEREAMVRALASRPSNAAFGTLHEFSVPPLPLAASNAPQSVQITTASDKSD
jgi:hypothetical protein